MPRGVATGSGGMVDAARELCVRGAAMARREPRRRRGMGPRACRRRGRAFAASAAAKVAEAISGDGVGRPRTTTRWTPRTRTRIRRDGGGGDERAAEADECAAECEAGGGAGDARCGSGCSRPRQIAAAPATAASRHEAAVYGAFAGDVRATLSACDDDWESSAWAYFRALLDARVDAAVDGREPGGAGPALVDDDDGDVALGVEKRDRDDDGDAADDHRVDAEIDAEGSALAAAARAAAAPRWPTADAAAATPPTAESILDALRPLAEAERPREARAQRDAQRCLILGRTRELVVECALRWVFPERVDGGGIGADGSGRRDGGEAPPPVCSASPRTSYCFCRRCFRTAADSPPAGPCTSTSIRCSTCSSCTSWRLGGTSSSRGTPGTCAPRRWWRRTRDFSNSSRPRPPNSNASACRTRRSGSAWRARVACARGCRARSTFRGAGWSRGGTRRARR